MLHAPCGDGTAQPFESMKKGFVIISLLVAGIAAYLYYGNPPTWLKETLKQNIPIKKSTSVYKWQDKQGNWQITDTPPAAGVPYETLNYHHDTNILPTDTLPDETKD